MKLIEKYKLPIIGITVGIIYGLATRLIFGERATLASITYLFVIPTILGIVPLMFVDKDKLRSYRNIIFIPWITILAFFLTMLFLRIEEMMCLIVLAAPFFILGTLGAVMYRFNRINEKKDKRKMFSLLLLPFLLAPIEEYVTSPSAIYKVESKTIISANQEIIWNNIVEVKDIQEKEYERGLFNNLGIPRPISATVDKRMNGGKRTGHFEGGLTFVETINRYEPNKTISFHITIDPKSVSPNVFQQHVLNGNYFSFVDASYTLNALPNGKTILTLTSKYQLTSKVNFYGKFWGDLLLEDFQDRLLEVIKNRCE